MRHFSTIALACITLAASARAQNHPQTRTGFTIGFGIGGGSASFSCDNCNSSGETGATGYLRIGGAVRPNLIVAGEANGWTKEENRATLSAGTVNAVLQWYPNPNGGFFVVGGVGFGSIDTQIEILGGTFSASKSGFGGQAGAGYDWRVARNFSLTPFGTFYATRVGDSDDNSRVTAKVFHFGLGFTWH